jgi:predicted enzyme related to lactoylglutathione lyase
MPDSTTRKGADMVEVTSYAPGTPSYIDLTTSDPAAARAFYAELFGWEYDVGGEETGFYAMAKVRGQQVAGIGQMPDAPTVWTTYLATDDLDETVRRVTQAGGKVMMEPMDVLEEGRMAIVSDPTGAAFGLWQAGRTIGSTLVNEPGAPSWNELVTRDLDAAQEFYTHVFGYEWEDIDTGEGGPRYKLLKVDGQPVGGSLQMDETWPPDIPSHWMAYFAVVDVDAAVEAAQRIGGQVHIPPTDSPFGRWAILTDPQGAAFTAIRLPDMAQQQ